MTTVSVTAPLPPLVLEGPDVRLRPWTARDLPCVADAATDPAITSITTVPATFSTESGIAFIERQHGRLRDGEGWALAIADVATDDALGHIGLWLHQIWKGRAEIGYWVRPGARGRGAAGAALALLADWALAHLDLHRLSLFIEPGNTASKRTADHGGFEYEARLRQWERIGTEPRDMDSYVRLRPSG
ncbi:MAG: GNAT family N-acetyltransferase [Actinomycetota bacterium]